MIRSSRAAALITAVSFVVAGVLALHLVFNNSTEGFLVGAAVAGIAVGLAAQDLIKNALGGLVIVFDPPFQIGDEAAIGSTRGEVVSIGLCSTRLRTPEDRLTFVPNAQVVSGRVSTRERQVVTDLFLPGWVDEARAKTIAYQAATSSQYVHLQKSIVVLVEDAFETTFVTHLTVKAHAIDGRYELLLKSDITERARRAFREQGFLRPAHAARVYGDLTNLLYTEANGQLPAWPADRTHPPSSHSPGESA